MLRLLRLSLGLSFLCAASAPLRAQLTENPFTIQPGKFLVEMDALTFQVDRSAPEKYDALGVANTLVSAGLTRDLDLQVGFQLFLRATYENRGVRRTSSGLGDLTFRTKWTFWRDDANSAAAALIPQVKIPSNTGGVGNGHVEGGLILPWTARLPGGFQAGAMLQTDVLHNPSRSRYDLQWLASGFIDRKFTRLVGVYGEVTAGISSTDSSTAGGSVGGGVTLDASENFQWDFAASRGFGASGTDWVYTVRFSWGL